MSLNADYALLRVELILIPTIQCRNFATFERHINQLLTLSDGSKVGVSVEKGLQIRDKTSWDTVRAAFGQEPKEQQLPVVREKITEFLRANANWFADLDYKKKVTPLLAMAILSEDFTIRQIHAVALSQKRLSVAS